MNEKEAFYAALQRQLVSLLEEETREITILANASALLFQMLEQVNWAGFYYYDKEKNELYLGPFQGKPACMRIPYGTGVCGTCAKTRVIQRVADVGQFPGHIACDAASRSEIVLPLLKKDTLLGVLDIDSMIPDRFDETDEEGLSGFVQTLLKFL